MSDFSDKLRDYPRCILTEFELGVLIGGSLPRRYNVIHRALKKRLLIKLKRGIYCINTPACTHAIHPFEIAQYLYGPSYISLESALSFHQLIPEAVHVITSVSTKRNKTMKNLYATFDYCKVPTKNMLCCVKNQSVGKTNFFIAEPFKAICDMVYCYRKKIDGFLGLQNDLRIEIDALPQLTESLQHELINYYQSSRVTQFLRQLQKEKTP